MLHPAGVIFKGSGWYATDSRPAAKDASNPSGDTPKADSKSEGAATPAPAKPEATSATAAAEG